MTSLEFSDVQAIMPGPDIPIGTLWQHKVFTPSKAGVARKKIHDILSEIFEF